MFILNYSIKILKFCKIEEKKEKKTPEKNRNHVDIMWRNFKKSKTFI